MAVWLMLFASEFYGTKDQVEGSITSRLLVTEGPNARTLCHEHGREALTFFQVLDEYHVADSEESRRLPETSFDVYTLVCAKPQTGSAWAAICFFFSRFQKKQ